MSITAAELQAKVSVDDRGLTSGLNRAERRVGSFGGALAGAGKAAALGLAGVTVAAGGAAAWGLKVAAANEQASIAFTTMLGSAQKAGAFLEDLKAFAAKTPFEFPELQTAASSLISVGIDASKVIPIMTTLGNVTSGMGTGSEGVKRATIALQQMSAAGRITGEDLNQLRDAGIPVFDLLAGATGRSKKEIVEMAKAGKLGAKELGQMMKALESGKGLERFAGLMEKQSESLTGMISTLKDTLGQGLAAAAQPLVKLAKNVIPTLMGPLGDLLDTFSEAASSVLPFFAGILSSLMPVIQPVASLLAMLADRLGKVLLPVLTALAPHLGAFIENLGGVFEALMPLLPPLGELLVALAPLLPVIAQLASEVLTVLIPPLAKLIGWVAKLADWLVGLLGPALEWVGRAVKKWGGILLLPISPLLIIIRNLDTLKKVAETVWNAMLSAIGEFVGVAISGFRMVANVFLSFVGTMLHGAATAFGWVPGIGGKLKAADKHFRRFKDSFLGELEDAATAARGWGSKVVDRFVDGMTAKEINAARAAGKISAAVARNLKQESPAKEGPMSRGGGTEGWGRRAVELFALGMTDALSRVTVASRGVAGLGAGAMPALPAPAASGRQAPTIIIQGNLIHERQLLDFMRSQQYVVQRHNGTLDLS